MRGATPIVLVGLLAATLGLTGSRSAAVTASDGAPTAAAAVSAAADEADGGDAPDVAESVLRAYLLTDGTGAAAAKQPGLRFLIASLPDPVDSGFDHLFDRAVASLTGALQRAGYYIDVFSDHPWPRGECD